LEKEQQSSRRVNTANSDFDCEEEEEEVTGDSLAAIPFTGNRREISGITIDDSQQMNRFSHSLNLGQLDSNNSGH